MSQLAPTLTPPLPTALPEIAQAGDDFDLAGFGPWLQARTTALHGTDMQADDADLAAFGRSVGDARIVMLGSQTHGEGNAYALKSRLVRYLHRELGFDVLLMGSGMYDGSKVGQRIAAGEPAAQAVDGALFYIYAQAEQTQALFDYVDATRDTERPLALGAFDVPQAGCHAKDALLSELAAYLAERGWPELLVHAAWRDFLHVADATIRMQPLDAALQPALPAFEAIYTELLARLSLEADATLRDGFWLQQLRSLHTAQQELAGQCSRDGQMAENLLWLAEHAYPGRRIVIWAHSMRCVPMRQYSMGDLLKQVYGDDVYIAWVTGHGGAALNYDSRQAYPLHTPPARSWEAVWHAHGPRAGFFDLRNLAREPGADEKLRNRLSIRAANYADDRAYGEDMLGRAAGDAPKVDGVFFLDEIEPVRLRSV